MPAVDSPMTVQLPFQRYRPAFRRNSSDSTMNRSKQPLYNLNAECHQKLALNRIDASMPCGGITTCDVDWIPEPSRMLRIGCHRVTNGDRSHLRVKEAVNRMMADGRVEYLYPDKLRSPMQRICLVKGRRRLHYSNICPTYVRHGSMSHGAPQGPWVFSSRRARRRRTTWWEC